MRENILLQKSRRLPTTSQRKMAMKLKTKTMMRRTMVLVLKTLMEKAMVTRITTPEEVPKSYHGSSAQRQ